MYREAGMSNSQKRSATRANRTPSGRPEAKRLPDRRGAQDPARGTACAQSSRRFRFAHSEVAECIRAFDWASTETGPVSDLSEDVQTAVTICADIASAQQAEFAAALEVHTRRAAVGSLASARSHRSMTAAQGDCDRPYAQDLTTKSKIPKARSERAHYNRCAGAPRLRRANVHGCAAHLKRGST
jgi:hypothetical protein